MWLLHHFEWSMGLIRHSPLARTSSTGEVARPRGVLALEPHPIPNSLLVPPRHRRRLNRQRLPDPKSRRRCLAGCVRLTTLAARRGGGARAVLGQLALSRYVGRFDGLGLPCNTRPHPRRLRVCQANANRPRRIVALSSMRRGRPIVLDGARRHMRRVLKAALVAFVVAAALFVRWFMKTASFAKGFTREPLRDRA